MSVTRTAFPSMHRSDNTSMVTLCTLERYRSRNLRARIGRKMRSLLLGLSVDQTRFVRRGFVCRSENARIHLEQIGSSFVHGYNSALSLDVVDLIKEFEGVHAPFRGFAFEGAAMAAGLLDAFRVFGRSRWDSLHELAGDKYTYLICVGIGWSWARLPVRVSHGLEKLKVLHKWLAIDGLGFHSGYFHPQTFVAKRMYPRNVSGYACKAFDQGLGRSLWFSQGAQAEGIATAIALFPDSRRADLWAGVGLACAYAGGVERSQIEKLQQLSGPLASALAQGAAFAAEARVRAAESVAWTDLACDVLCGSDAVAAAAHVRASRECVPLSSTIERYEIWRQNVREKYSTR